WRLASGLQLYFFLQAEDCIRDGHVTGVQTCALPLSAGDASSPRPVRSPSAPSPSPRAARARRSRRRRARRLPARSSRATFSLRRSEEHTSELQSRGHLVCRLLLEKKKNITPNCSVAA